MLGDAVVQHFDTILLIDGVQDFNFSILTGLARNNFLDDEDFVGEFIDYLVEENTLQMQPKVPLAINLWLMY